MNIRTKHSTKGQQVKMINRRGVRFNAHTMEIVHFASDHSFRSGSVVIYPDVNLF